MAIVHLTEKNFDSIIQHNPIVLIDFWAEWCGPCKSFAKIYEAVSELFPDIIFAKVNIDEEPSLKEDFQIMSIPQLVIFKDEVVIFSQAGLLPASALKDLVDQAKKVDVNGLK